MIIFLPLLFTTASALSSPLPYGDTPKNVASRILQGAGPVAVDLNQYNLPSLQEISSEWTCNFVTESTKSQARLAMGAQNERENYVDVVTVSFPRQPRLGIELEELQGGREDGIGVTLITGLVEGGAAEGSDIVPGDVLSKVTLTRTSRNKLTEAQEIYTAQTECLDYDRTIDAIQSLPPLDTNCQETYTLTLKRLRRKPVVNVKLQYPPSQGEDDETIQMFAGENLRQGMLVRGVKLNDELAKRFDTKSSGNCGAGGLCRTCAVSVLQGQDLLNPQRTAEQQMLADSPRWRLACKAIVGYGMKEGTMTVRVNPRQWD